MSIYGVGQDRQESSVPNAVTLVAMRNLTLSAVQISVLRAEDVIQFSSPTSDDVSATLSAIAFDSDRSAIFAGTESPRGGILVWRTSDNVSLTSECGSFLFCASYASSSGIASLRVLSESNQLVLVTRGGEIVVWELDESGSPVVSGQRGLLSF